MFSFLDNEVVFNDSAGSRKTSSAFRKISSSPRRNSFASRKSSSASRKSSSGSLEGEIIEGCDDDISHKTQGTDPIESEENVGIKYLLEDLHVIRQMDGKFSGLRTSTLALTVCLSLSLGIYLGNCK